MIKIKAAKRNSCLITNIFFLNIIINLYCGLCYSLSDQTIAVLDNFIKRYERPVTVVEICASQRPWSAWANFNTHTSAKMSKQRIKIIDPSTSVVMPVAENGYVQEIIQNNLPNAVVVMPPDLNTSLLEKFAACEQPDIVVVHDISDFIALDAPFFEALFKLGDYIACEINTKYLKYFDKYIANNCKKLLAKHDDNNLSFYMVKTDKRGLEVARWNIKKKDNSTIKYEVASDFSKKYLRKKEPQGLSLWQPGINLLTFTMLSGVYPSDLAIINMIKKFKESAKYKEHNDLVIGNILIQGTRLRPIDFNDERRDISFQICIDALLSAFRLRASADDPKAFFDYYTRALLGDD